MALTYPYTDAYLAPLVTQAREAKALADVADLGTLPDVWVERLAVLRTYIITCLESQKAPDDMFGVKLSAYRKEWTEALAQARAAQIAAEAAAGTAAGGGSAFSVELVRS